jgi:hypothetical protein
MLKTTDDSFNWLVELHNIREAIEIEVGYLASLSRAFIVTGNDRMGEELMQAAKVLSEQAERIDMVTHVKTKADLRRAQESSANMLGAILAGIEVGKEEE